MYMNMSVARLNHVHDWHSQEGMHMHFLYNK